MLSSGSDATFKQCFGKWAIAPIGVLAKSFGCTTKQYRGVVQAWATHLVPLVWVVSSGELSGAYALGLRVLLKAAKELVGLDLQNVVRQLHADLTQTAEKARSALLPRAVRASDCWHTLEVTKGMLETTLVKRTEDGELRYYNEILSWVHMSRTHCMRLTEVDNLWSLLFQHYSSREIGESEAVT